MLSLFNSLPIDNILPKDGVAQYYGKVIPTSYFDALLHSIDWKNDEVYIYGKKIITKRKTAWYGDNNIAYTYSKSTKIALPFTPILIEIKNIVEQICDAQFNACLLNLYQNGSEAMAWHCDNEPSIVKHSTIASVSLGAERKFSFKHKISNEKIDILLENGSLLAMKNEIQDFWLHALPQQNKVLTPRINLTFRQMMK